jgi:hypothetical protein
VSVLEGTNPTEEINVAKRVNQACDLVLGRREICEEDKHDREKQDTKNHEVVLDKLFRRDYRLGRHF